MNSSQGFVSIGLPVYNGQKYLEQSIDSILCQTYPNFELILSDNASTDRTQAICQRYAGQDPRVRYYRNETNIGAAPNFNRVVELATGEFFRWASYDDFIAPDLLARCMEAFEQHPEAILCYPKSYLVDEHGSILEEYDPIPNVVSLERPSGRFREFILHPHLANHIFGVYRRSALQKTHLHQSFPSSDEVLLAELSLLGKLIEVPERLFYNRVHEEQSTRSALSSQRSRAAWVDTALKGKVILAHWMYFFGCLKVIRSAPVSFQEKAACYGVMARWLVMPAHFRAMGKDVLLAVMKLFRSAAASIRLQFHSTQRDSETR